MTMTASAHHAGHMCETGEDPVLAAVRRARLRPPLPQDNRAVLVALDAEAASDPETWQPFEGLFAELAALRPSADG